jgi:GR25 family glycosyltransferase involved in LPS biosynthesis
MDCYYINLESAGARRRRLEENFSSCKAEHWALHRFPATDAHSVDARNFPGPLKPAEKACFLSHRKLLQSCLGDEKDILVMEDDTSFGRHSCVAIDQFLQYNYTAPWDIVYTDIIVPRVETMVELIHYRRQLSAAGRFTLLDLTNVMFAGTSAYIVNGKSKRKLAALLECSQGLHMPYDLHLRKLIQERKLAGFTFFPFITCVSECSEVSQVQATDELDTDRIWNSFRKLIWMDRDLEAQKPKLREIDSQLCDDESRLFGVLFSALTSRQFRRK